MKNVREIWGGWVKSLFFASNLWLWERWIFRDIKFLPQISLSLLLSLAVQKGDEGCGCVDQQWEGENVRDLERVKVKKVEEGEEIWGFGSFGREGIVFLENKSEELICGRGESTIFLETLRGSLLV
jgi:hypothetical protein